MFYGARRSESFGSLLLLTVGLGGHGEGKVWDEGRGGARQYNTLRNETG